MGGWPTASSFLSGSPDWLSTVSIDVPLAGNVICPAYAEPVINKSKIVIIVLFILLILRTICFRTNCICCTCRKLWAKNWVSHFYFNGCWKKIHINKVINRLSKFFMYLTIIYRNFVTNRMEFTIFNRIHLAYLLIIAVFCCNRYSNKFIRPIFNWVYQ